MLSLLLVLSFFPSYSSFTHPLGNSDLLQTSVYCAFHLSTLSHTFNTLSLTVTPRQHSGTHFLKTSDYLSQFLSLDQHSRPTFFQYKDLYIVLIDWLREREREREREWEWVCVCVCVYLVSGLHVVKRFICFKFLSSAIVFIAIENNERKKRLFLLLLKTKREKTLHWSSYCFVKILHVL